MLETCLEHENYTYERTLFADISDESVEQTLVARVKGTYKGQIVTGTALVELIGAWPKRK